MPLLLRISVNLTPKLKALIQAQSLSEKGQTLLNALDVSEAELSLSVVEDQEIRELNAEYRGEDYATDVLSFPMLEEFDPKAMEGAILLGDVVISAETALKQAGELGVSLEDEVARLLCHGVLHLLGYDHEDVPESEAERMERKEQELFELIC